MFSADALKTVYAVTKGIPRLVNLLCERCLMGAFSKQVMVIDSDIVMRSAEEALPPSVLQSEVRDEKKAGHWIIPFAFLTMLGAGVGLSFIF